MTGAPAARRDVQSGATGVGNLYLALDPDRFVGRERFLERIGWFVETIKETPSAPGLGEVLVPGELEAREAETARMLGVQPDPSAVPALRAIASELEIPFPSER